MQLFASIILTVITFLAFAGRTLAIDIGPMTWTPRADWNNVKSGAATTGGPNAVGDGVADDTAALQAVLTFVQNHMDGQTHACPK